MPKNDFDVVSRKGLLLSLPLFNSDQNGYPLNGGIQYARAMIEAAPTMDAVEVVHGRWITVGGNHYTRISQCTNCCAKYDFRSNYCPNCGAKMDGDGNG